MHLSLKNVVVAAMVAAAGVASAAQKEFSGATNGYWDDAANWTPEGVPTAADGVTISAKTVNATNGFSVASLALDGATLKVGDISARPAIAVTVVNGVTLTGASKLYVYAPELADRTIYETCYTNYPSLYPVLWNAAVRVNIGGNLNVGDTSVVYPDAAPATGVPVFFKVAGDFTLGESAKFDVIDRGWSWFTGSAPTGGKPCRTEGWDIRDGWTYAPGAGLSYATGARYGGNDGGTSWNSKPYGKSYGYECAPFLPGSPGGKYQSANHGNGSIVVFTKGTATVNGQLIAGTSPKKDHSGDSGGGIWLTADTFSFGANASVVAIGRNTNSGAYNPGGGGRVCFSEGLTSDEDIALFAAGNVPGGYTPAEILDEVSVDVKGGYNEGGKWYGTTGSAKFVRSATAKVKVEVTISGSGSVTVGGETYSESFEVMVDPNTDIPFVATPAQDWRFNYWLGPKLPGGNSDQANVALNTDVPTTLTVQFLTGTVDKRWIGAANASWEDAANWSPAGVPGQYDAVYMTNATTTLTRPTHLSKLVIAGNSQVTFSAPALEGNSDFTNLYANACVVQIDQSLEVSGTATLTLKNDKRTGAPVKLVTADLLLAATAKISADGTGWGWTEGTDEYAVTSTASYSTRGKGAGYDFNHGASYGNYGNSYTRGPYGYKYAPFMPGSPNGCYGNKLANTRAGGGTVWIDCSGTAVINGAITAKGEWNSSYGSPSGGGIWICAAAVEAAPTASLSAEGGYQSGENLYGSVGSGGRVSLGIGLTQQQKDALAAGEEPEGLYYSDTIDLMRADALGARENRKALYRGNPGTCTTVIGTAGQCEVVVRGSPVEAIGLEPSYGLIARDLNSVQTFTAQQYGYDPADANIRYTCAGYVVSNALGHVTAGAGSSVEVTMENGPVSVTWLWGAREARVAVTKPANGVLTLEGVAQPGDIAVWQGGTSAPIGVKPDDGYEFIGWSGVLPKDCWAANPLVVTGALATEITPIVRLIEEPTTRQWNATGDWTDPTKWSPAGNIPGALDTVVIKGKTCTIRDYAICSNLVVEGGTLKIGVDVNRANHPKLVVTHDLTATNTAAINIYGGPIEEGYTFAAGTAFLEVGGEFRLTGSSVYSPYSQYLNGGSPVTYARTFAITTNATVNANEKGYYWMDGSTPPDAPGLGFSYTEGGSYGNGKYGFKYAPVHPGSPNGNYNSGYKNPGGLIRIHARAMSLAGTLTANGKTDSSYGGPSGGGIWLTADAFDFVPGAVFRANGGNSNYGSIGTGGRIAFTEKADAKRLAELAETGTFSVMKDARAMSLDDFLAAHPDVTVEVLGGGSPHDAKTHTGPVGSFWFVDAKRWGTMIIVR